MDAARETRRHLGQILVEEGFLTPDALADALKEHGRTQRPLGEVLVELGMVSPGAIANALAEQHGGLLRTEYGISAGLRSRSSVAPESTSAPGSPPMQEPQPIAEPEPHVDPDGERRPLLRAVAAPEPAAPEPAAPEPEPVPAQPAPELSPDVLEAWRTALAERDRVIGELSDAVRSRDADLVHLRAQPVETPAAEPDTAELDALNAQLAATQTELVRLRATLTERDGELAASDARGAALTGELEALQARLASAGSSADDRSRDLAEAHLQTATFSAEVQALRPRLAAAETELEALRSRVATAEGAVQAERDARAGDIESSARKVANANAAVARLQAQLEGREDELGTLKAAAADNSRELGFLRSRLAAIQAPPEPPAPEPPDNGPHVLFVPRNGGYELVEQEGPAPARGATVEADGAVYLVAKVGPSPRPGEQRTCVYLVQA